MHCDESLPGRTVYQPETEVEVEHLRSVKRHLKVLDGSLTAFWTPDVADYPALDADSRFDSALAISVGAPERGPFRDLLASINWSDVGFVFGVLLFFAGVLLEG